MALQKRMLTVPMQLGESAEADVKLLPQGTFSTIQNLRFDAAGTLVKRYGYKVPSADLSYPATPGTAAGTIRRVASVGDDKLVQYGDTLHSLTAAGLVSRGHVPACSYPERTVIQREPNTAAKNPSVAYANGYSCYVWVEPQESSVTATAALFWGDIRARVYDEETGAIVDEVTLYTAASGYFGWYPKVVAADGQFVIVYEGTDVPFTYQTVFVVTRPATYPQAAWTAGSTILYGGATRVGWDIATDGTDWYILWDTATTLDIERRDATALTVSASSTNAITSTFSRMEMRSTLGWVVYQGGADIRYFVFDPTTCAIGTTRLAIAAETFGSVAMCPVSDTEEVFWFWRAYTGPTWASAAHSVSRSMLVDSVGTVGTVTVNYGLHPITHSGFAFNSVQYAMAGYTSDEGQASLYLVRLEERSGEYVPVPEAILSRGNYGTQGFFPSECQVALIGGDSSTEYRFAEAEDFRVAEITRDGYIGMPGVSSWKFSLDNPQKFTSVTADGSVYFPGGMVAQYDGAQVVEMGWCMAPEINVVAASSGTGQLTTGENYQYTATYEWIDARGKRHVSAPAIPQQVTATSTKIVEVEVTCLPLTLKGGATNGEVEIHVWRTDGNGSVFRRITTGSNEILVSTPTAFSQSISDDGTETGEVLYTTAGILPASQPVTARHLTYHGNRLWAADGKTLHYSRLRNSTEALQWADTQEMPVAQSDVYALGSIDTALVALEENGVFLVYGDGPTDRGDGGGFSEASRVPSDVGTTEPRSVLAWSGGLFFQGARGIYNMPRAAGTPEWIGSKVRADTGACIGAALVPAQDHARFTFSNVVLCLDTRTREWVRYVYKDDAQDDINLRGSGLWGSTWVGIDRLNNNLMTEDGNYVDSTQPIPSTFTTGDIRPAGAQGYLRLYKVGLLMSAVGASEVQIGVQYDSQGSLTYATPITPTSSAQAEIQWQPSRQRCSAFRITVIDYPEEPVQGIEYNALTLTVGGLPGTNRLPASNRSA